MKSSKCSTDNPGPGRSCRIIKKSSKEKCYGTDKGNGRAADTFEQQTVY